MFPEENFFYPVLVDKILNMKVFKKIMKNLYITAYKLSNSIY